MEMMPIIVEKFGLPAGIIAMLIMGYFVVLFFALKWYFRFDAARYKSLRVEFQQELNKLTASVNTMASSVNDLIKITAVNVNDVKHMKEDIKELKQKIYS